MVVNTWPEYTQLDHICVVVWWKLKTASGIKLNVSFISVWKTVQLNITHTSCLLFKSFDCSSTFWSFGGYQCRSKLARLPAGNRITKGMNIRFCYQGTHSSLLYRCHNRQTLDEYKAAIFGPGFDFRFRFKIRINLSIYSYNFLPQLSPIY